MGTKKRWRDLSYTQRVAVLGCTLQVSLMAAAVLASFRAAYSTGRTLEFLEQVFQRRLVVFLENLKNRLRLCQVLDTRLLNGLLVGDVAV